MDNNKDNIMRVETILPPDFDGTFRFTNWTNEDFVGVWGSKKYLFPAQSTSPMIIPDHTPIEIQHIRKKFAKDLAEQQFFKSKEYKKLYSQEHNPDGSPRLNSIQMAGTYTLTELTPYIQRCLEPLPVARAIVTEVERPKLEDTLSRDDEGQLNTEAIDKKASLREKALKK